MGAGTGIGQTYTTYRERTSAPSTPSANYDRLFFKADGLHYINSAGADVPVKAGFSVDYAADAGSTDAYAVTLVPSPATYSTGMVICFKANTANTGAATLNVNSLGAKNILKHHDQTLADGDIEAGQLVTVRYDGTQWQMQSPVGLVTGTGAVVLANSPTLVTPALTGTPTAPTAASSTNTTQIATTAFVQTEVTAVGIATVGAADCENVVEDLSWLPPVTFTWDPGSLDDGVGETSAAIAVPGAVLGSTIVQCVAPYDLQGITLNAWVDAANSCQARLQNETAGTINLASGTWVMQGRRI
jgi:hypothetical protein